MVNFKITSGTIERPQRVVLYGPEGIGKTTLASLVSDSIFIDTEDGTGHVMCYRLESPTTWGVLLQQVEWLTANPQDASTIVIDTIDAAEIMCQRQVCMLKNWKSIEDPGYGKGYVAVREEFDRLLAACDKAVAAGLNVILVAHATARKFEQPGEGAFDKWELKLDKRVAARVKEWCDALLFLNYKIYVVDGKASGGRRTLHCNHGAVWDAKNRWGLPDELDLDRDDGAMKIAEHLPKRAMPAGGPQKAETEPQPALAAKELHELSADEMNDERARREALPAYFKPLLDLMAGTCTIEELETVMVFKGKREQGQPMENWGKSFVEWTVSQWAGVEKALKEIREVKMVAAATDVPF